jgi:magnesium chelatase subunit I
MAAAKPRTVGELRASGARPVPVKEELRRNLLRKLRAKEPLFPGLIGYDRTVIPALQNAILARHDFLLLGLRGQGKSRILRALPTLLDPEVPVVPGCELNDHPLQPLCKRCRRTLTDASEIAWLAPAERYREKLATPDVTMADLIGDVDPIKAAAERRALSDEEVIQYGILPRTHRGIFALNELPDLPTRIQVGLLSILEERELQIRGFPVRLPIDVCIVSTANPEDYTQRGSLITPLKDRLDSQILTHYPERLEDALAITKQEAWTEREGAPAVTLPALVLEIVEEIAFQARRSEFVDPKSGVSARLSISAAECVVSNAERRALVQGAARGRVRIADLYAALPAVAGKVELVFEGEREGAAGVARRLVGQAVLAAFRRRFPDAYESTSPAPSKPAKPGPGTKDDPEGDSEYKPVLDWFARGGRVEVGDLLPDRDHEAALRAVPGLAELAGRHHDGPAEELPLVMEFVLEGLHQCSRIAREDLESGVSYKDLLKTMFEGMGRTRG